MSESLQSFVLTFQPKKFPSIEFEDSTLKRVIFNVETSKFIGLPKLMILTKILFE